MKSQQYSPLIQGKKSPNVPEPLTIKSGIFGIFGKINLLSIPLGSKLALTGAVGLTVLEKAAVLAGMLLLPQFVSAQNVTNWIAYHDHRTGALTSPNASVFDIRVTGEGGILKNFATGAELPVSVSVTGVGIPDDLGTSAYPDADSPAFKHFDGIADIGTGGTIGVRSSTGSTVVLTFKNLDPTKKYSFTGTGIRGGSYVDRWIVCTVQGADAFTAAHQAAGDPLNLITKASFPAATLTDVQVALNSGENRVGSLIAWEGIDPGADGEFSILTEQYVGPHPLGGTNAGAYGYGITAFSLKEVSVNQAINITSHPARVSASPGQNVSFTVATTGTGVAYQWQKSDPGSPTFSNIPNAMSATYAAGAATLSMDGTRYRAIVTGQGLTLTSRAALLTVRGNLIEVPGLLKMEIYRDLAGVLIDDLLNAAKYPASPDESTAISGIDTRSTLPTNALNNYGAAISGLIIPDQTGDYDFMLRSDDAGRLFISTDASTANLVMVAEEATCCAAFEEPGVSARTTAAPIPLVAGRKYAIRALLKEGGGGDYLQVAWRKTGDTTPAANLTPISPAFVSSMFPEQGSINITTQPVDITAPRNSMITLAVVANSTRSPLLVQWLRNGVIMPGRTGASIQYGPLAASDHNAIFQAVLSAPGNTKRSSAVTLTVTSDTTPPAILRLASSDTFNKLTVDFTEAVTPASAGAPGNYLLNGGLSVLSVQIISPTRVVLTTSLQGQATAYILTIKDITDTAGLKNVANASAAFTSFEKAKGGLKFEAWNGITGTAIANLLDAPKYLEPADFTGYVISADSRRIYPDDSHENYGARISGWLVPTETASYDFMLRSDDAGQLSLSTDDTAGALVVIATETGCCGGFEEPGGEATTVAPIDLVANRRYFFELLYKEGGGGDYAQVAWRKSTDATPAGTLTAIPGSFFEIIAAPGTLTPPTIVFTSPLPGVAVPENVPFQVVVSPTVAPGKTATRVEIFRGATRIADLASAPYLADVPALAADIYSFTARVTDSAGLIATTPAYPVSVGAPRELRNLLLMDDITTWRYNRSGTDLGTDWRANAYADNTWPVGFALIGEEPTAFTIPLRTPISRLTDDGTYIKTMYFRGRFNWTGTTSGAKLSLRHVIDDGAVFYLNGTEVHRFGIDPAVVVDATTDATGHEQLLEGPYSIPETLLRNGENVLAVEVHQAGASSSDIVFGAELTATVPTGPQTGDPEFTKVQISGANLLLEWKNGRLQSLPLLSPGPWVDVPGATSPYSTPATSGKRFFRIAK